MNTNKATYTLQTPEHSYDFVPIPGNPDLVRVYSDEKESIEDFISTVELAGPEEGRELPEMLLEEQDTTYDHVYFVEVSKATLSLFLDFEVRYYMGASLV